MPETGTFTRARSIFDASMQVLRANKPLFVFNIVGMSLVVGAAAAIFGLGVLKNPDLHLSSVWQRLVVFYLLMMFLSTFSQAAFVHEAMMAFNGNPVSVRRGFAFAFRRIKAILFWSLFAGVVGLLINRLEQKLSIFGKLSMRLIGMAWSVASIFAIQVLLREKTSNPIELLRKSSLTLKRKWGETIAGYVGVTAGLGFVVFALTIGGMVLGIVLARMDVLPEPAPGSRAIFIAIGAVALLVVAVFAGTIDEIFRCALYVYATEETIPAPFDPALMDAAWKIKKS
jgi:hypothetical protein